MVTHEPSVCDINNNHGIQHTPIALDRQSMNTIH